VNWLIPGATTGLESSVTIMAAFADWNENSPQTSATAAMPMPMRLFLNGFILFGPTCCFVNL
jgi:hypothetical protein